MESLQSNASSCSGWGSDFEDTDDYYQRPTSLKYPNPNKDNVYKDNNNNNNNSNNNNNNNNKNNSENVYGNIETVQQPTNSNKTAAPKPTPRKRSDLQRKPSEPPIPEDQPAPADYNNPPTLQVIL